MFLCSKTFYNINLLRKETSVLYRKIKILFIADTHNELKHDKNALLTLKNEQDFDCCILLGDHGCDDLKIITELIPVEKIYGVLGNHDEWGRYEQYNIKDIHCRSMIINGVKIVGLSGSYKYKDTDIYAMITQQESVELTNKLPYADIFVTHAESLRGNSDENLHDGLEGIKTYIDKYDIPYHVHGHMHTNDEINIKNTKSVGVYGTRIISFEFN